MTPSSEASSEQSHDDRLKLLMDYTKFHILMYTTLISSLLATLALDVMKAKAAAFSPFLWLTMGFFLLAGGFGGFVGSSLPDYRSYRGFIEAKLGPWDAKWIKASTCVHSEHTFFWLGILIAVAGLCSRRFRDHWGPANHPCTCRPSVT